MRRTLVRLLMLGLIAAPLAGIHAQKPGQTGEQPPYDSSVGPGYVAELTKRESEERRQIMTLSERLGTEHPTVEKLRRQLEFTQSELKKLSTGQPGDVDDKQAFNFFMGLTTGELTEPSEQQVRQAFTGLVNTLRSATDEKEQEEARTKLSHLLKFQLGKDLAKQEERLSASEKKLAKLREQLDARKKNKDKVADVLLLMIESPEAGVGIPSEWLRSIMPPPRATNSNPFDPSPSDPFGGSPAGGEDAFGASSGGDDSFSSNPFEDAISPPKNDPFADELNSNPFGGPSPAYEVSVDGNDIAVYETYDKGIPILTREEWKIEPGGSVDLSASTYSSIWMTTKGIIEVRPHPTDREKIVLIGVKTGRVQIALHPRSMGMSQGIFRINVEVTESDPADTQPSLPR